ncbi:glycosyl transferase [Marivirga lumbricoides]|uniref:Glycosyl transferase n=1 Tax=Marivirga lumbricoides TaxID=1046115 RepID=A0ABQ1LQC9_9BACT|nr:glycosyl transferase [Marivirga lumbricoides]
MSFNISSVILHYNSINSLRKVIEAVKNQTYNVGQIIVVDNGSPGFKLDEFPDVELLELTRNEGVGKGHNTGWKYALDKYNPDFIWSLEHDCIPFDNCLEELVKHYKRDEFACYCAVEKNDYQFDKYKHFIFNSTGFAEIVDKTKLDNYKGGLSFNGLLLPTWIIEKVGFLNEEFFIGREDIDFYKRIYKMGGYSLRITSALTHHDMHKDKKVLKFGNRVFLFPAQSLFREYYSSRNAYYHALKEGTSGFKLKLKFIRGLLITFIMRNQKIKRIKLRIKAYNDALSGRMGAAELKL